ncbi:hypothetical protein BMS3Abin07_01250 [bacterium BMS3Abin07]|nr:hypothetical protein BMS3Abin07_01250 [bacterium BMS3Abin07]GBE33217.1 hypothetical protein BMS3Bbin05_02156 [bacterium BMS3Bbin05]HDO22769.1 hypothetical protein [Nitrospirota bacterium]HDZ87516.1 hypothetical protein [Nitrospirota bacterium]
MKCSICHKDFSPLNHYKKPSSALCRSCASETKDSFIFYCHNCGSHEVVNKEMAILFAPNHTIKRQLLLLKNDNVIIEQDSCITCAGVHVC